MMDWYVAQHRSTGLLYIYKRSFFASYDYPTKKKLYLQGKKYHSYQTPPNFRGKFTKYFVVDKEQYEIKKQQAINSWLKNTKTESLWKEQRDVLMKEGYESGKYSIKELAEIINLGDRQVRRIVT